jgi:hypothetical protein
MSKEKFVDPRTPVSVTQVGKWKVTIYDQAAYDASLREYPDSGETRIAKGDNARSQFKKGKPAARYSWTEKLKTPLPLTFAASEGETA